ncbi:MAG: hypothetical protein II840_10405 [Kiritimatiellae bacterium]|nr:hypothetical protein [Kiritimatiellia bacterium]
MTAEALEAIENCGAAEMPIAETCAIAEISEADYWADENAQKRYRIGQLRSKLEIRQAVIKMAKAGTPQMVKVYQDFVAENERNLPPPKEPGPETTEEFDEI